MARALEEISLVEVRNERQIGAQGESLAQFTSVRALSAGTGVLSVGTRAQKPTSAVANDEYFESDTSWRYRWTGTAWAYTAGANTGTNAARAAITVTASDNGAWFYATDTKLLWRVAAGAWAQSDITPVAHKDLHKSGGADAFTSSDLLEAIVKRLQTSTGPTTLTLGAIADGEFLKRSGTDIIGGAVTLTFTAISSFLNSWVNFGATETVAGYAAGFGVVFLEGLIKSGTIGSAAFNIPAPARPSKTVYLGTSSHTGAALVVSRLRVDTNGDLVPEIGANGSYCLDGLFYPL